MNMPACGTLTRLAALNSFSRVRGEGKPSSKDLVGEGSARLRVR